MTLESLDKLRELAADINAKEIIDHMTLYPSCTFDGHWLDSWHMEFGRLLDAIQAEVDSRYMELPLDADGVPIRVGDVMCSAGIREKGHRVIVSAIFEDGFVEYRNDNGLIGPLFQEDWVHVKPRTVEDVLRDVLHDSYTMGASEIVERYAQELRMRDGDD